MVIARDSGIGMSPEVRERIFEPFFTTKERGRGTGLGLALVYSMVQQAGGLIRVESAPGEGTTFRLYLRRVASGAFAAAASDDAVPAGGAGERVLVAEDDAAVRAMTVQQLERAGYVVVGAEDGASALHVLERDASFDLLLTDVVMPGLHGRELLARVHRTAPALPVLVMSGYADDDTLVRDVLASAVPYLPKPFTTSQLLARVHETLSAAGRRRTTGVAGGTAGADAIPPAPAR
jgi:CheY-like chemotaxis protein